MQNRSARYRNLGMHRDRSASVQEGTLAFENRNVRILSRGKDTALSVTNERGNAPITLTAYEGTDADGTAFTGATAIEGTVIGWAVLNRWLVLFTVQESGETLSVSPELLHCTAGEGTLALAVSSDTSWTAATGDGDFVPSSTAGTGIDRIYRIEYAEDGGWYCALLYEGSLSFDGRHPVETIPFYETEDVQKVYWVDGLNQPRAINIMRSYFSGGEATVRGTYFDFVTAFSPGLSVTVTKNQDGTGSFPSGVVQWVVTYCNKYGQETNAAYITPQHYTSNGSRGGSPEETQTCSFTLTLTGLDTSFGFVRVYGLIYTSENGTPAAWLAGEVNISGGSDTITLTDNGTRDAAVDPTLLLYLGGTEMSAGTFTHKDNTLFLGDLGYTGSQDDSLVADAIASAGMYSTDDGEGMYLSTGAVRFVRSTAPGHEIPHPGCSGLYPYVSQLEYASSQIRCFKGGEKYRFAVQFVSATGQRSRAFFIGDAVNAVYPEPDSATGNISRAVVQAVLPATVTAAALAAGYVSAVLMMAVPSEGDRSILAQGVVCPTCFNLKHRYDNAPFSVSSWYMRARGMGISSRHMESVNHNLLVRETGEDGGYTHTLEHDIQQALLAGASPQRDEIQNISFTVNPFYTEADFDELAMYEFFSLTGVYNELSTCWHAWCLHFTYYYSRSERTGYWKDHNDNVLYAQDSSWEDPDGKKHSMTKGSRIEYDYNSGQSMHREMLLYFQNSRAMTEKYGYKTGSGSKYKVWTNKARPWFEKQSMPSSLLWAWSTVNTCMMNTSPDTGRAYNRGRVRWVFGNQGKSRSLTESSDAYGRLWSMQNREQYYVDENVVTFHTPEIDALAPYDGSPGLKFRIVGVAPVRSNITDYAITTTTGSVTGAGITEVTLNHEDDDVSTYDGLITHPLLHEGKYLLDTDFDEDKTEDWDPVNEVYRKFGSYLRELLKEGDDKDGATVSTESAGTDDEGYFAVYPFHKEGSMHHSELVVDGFSEVETKTEANLRYSFMTRYLWTGGDAWLPGGTGEICAPRFFNSEELEYKQFEHPDGDKVYMGNLDHLSTGYGGRQFHLLCTDGNIYTSADDMDSQTLVPWSRSTEAVRIQYRSTPHMLFSLGAMDGAPVLLPVTNEEYEPYAVPPQEGLFPWDDSGEYGYTGFAVHPEGADGYTVEEQDGYYGLYAGGSRLDYSGFADAIANTGGSAYWLAVLDGGTLRLRQVTSTALRIDVPKTITYSYAYDGDSGTAVHAFAASFLSEKADAGVLTAHFTLYGVSDEGERAALYSGFTTGFSREDGVLSSGVTVEEAGVMLEEGKGYCVGVYLSGTGVLTAGEAYTDTFTYDGSGSASVDADGAPEAETFLVTLSDPASSSMVLADSVDAGIYQYTWDADGGTYTRTRLDGKKAISYCSSVAGDGTYEPDEPYWLVGELYREFGTGSADTRYGGNTEYALEQCTFTAIGESSQLGSGALTLTGSDGDTWFQRWDCLKTYPYSEDSHNGIVDIASFMVETHTNIDGRYDIRRGLLTNVSTTPENSNLINRVYSTLGSLFSASVLDDKYYLSSFPSQITWTGTKSPGADTDEWMHLTGASVLDLDGDKGRVRALRRFNNEIYAFQDKGVAQVLFNSRTQLSTEQGVPVEIANSGKVDGKAYVSDKWGCVNKWSMAETKGGILFVDDINGALVRLSDGFADVGLASGFAEWFKARRSLDVWNPVDFGNFIAFRDKDRDDVYLTLGRESLWGSLCYSERLGAFTSFLDYGGVPVMDSVEDALVSFRDGGLWLQNRGEYNSFFGERRPYSVTFRVAPGPYGDKTFNNMEWRADIVANGGDWEDDAPEQTEYLTDRTWDSLDVWNEYQSGHLDLLPETFRPGEIKRKFRIWRTVMPRDAGDPRGLDRIRNPWAFVRLTKDRDLLDERMEMHDFRIDWFEM